MVITILKYQPWIQPMAILETDRLPPTCALLLYVLLIKGLIPFYKVLVQSLSLLPMHKKSAPYQCSSNISLCADQGRFALLSSYQALSNRYKPPRCSHAHIHKLCINMFELVRFLNTFTQHLHPETPRKKRNLLFFVEKIDNLTGRWCNINSTGFKYVLVRKGRKSIKLSL